jgi:hypothetical protein
VRDRPGLYQQDGPDRALFAGAFHGSGALDRERR